MKAPAIYQWHDLHAGLVVQFDFTVSAADMKAFLALSGDSSRIHINDEFARKNGFAGPVVYGAIVVAKLSCLVGVHLPGDLGLATEWRINFNNPLYVDDHATMRGEITHVSEATRTVKLRFSVVSGTRTIASGTAGSKLLTE